MERYPDRVEALLEAICIGRETYGDLGRRIFSDVITDDDGDSAIRSAISIIAQRYLTESERQEHKRRRYRVIPAGTQEVTLGTSQAIPRSTQEKSIIARGGRPWSDAEESVLIAIMRRFKKEVASGLQTDWHKVADTMNMVFQTDEFKSLQCRNHGLDILKRHRRGIYGRGMPVTNVDALNKAIAFLQPPQNGVDAVTARTITEIQILLMQESNPDSTSLFRLIEEINLFTRDIDFMCIDDRTRRRAAVYRAKLLEADALVEVSGETHLYGKLTMIINFERGKIVELLSPR